MVAESWSEILEWSPKSRRGINMGLGNIYSTQVWLVMNLVNGSMSMSLHIIFDDMLYTVLSTFPKIWIRMVMPINLSIWFVLDQYYNPYMYGK